MIGCGVGPTWWTRRPGGGAVPGGLVYLVDEGAYQVDEGDYLVTAGALVAAPVAATAPGLPGQIAWVEPVLSWCVARYAWVRMWPEWSWPAVPGAPAPSSGGTFGDLRLVGGYVYLCLGAVHVRLALERVWSGGDLAPDAAGAVGDWQWIDPYWHLCYAPDSWGRLVPERVF